jgi:hypothetical protein
VLGKHVINPGDKTEMKVIFKTEGAPGPFHKKITMTTDAEGQEEIMLSMTGTVKEARGAKMQVSPRKADFGTVKMGTAARLRYSVTNTGAMPLIITKIYAQVNSQVFFDGTLKEMVIEPGKTEDLTLEITPQKSGPFSDRIVIVSNAKNASKGGYIVLATGQVE